MELIRGRYLYSIFDRRFQLPGGLINSAVCVFLHCTTHHLPWLGERRVRDGSRARVGWLKGYQFFRSLLLNCAVIFHNRTNTQKWMMVSSNISIFPPFNFFPPVYLHASRVDCGAVAINTLSRQLFIRTHN